MSTANFIEEAVPPGSVVVRTSGNRPLFEFMELIRPCFGETLSLAQTARDADGRERVRWLLGQSRSELQPGYSQNEFLTALKQMCATARRTAEELKQTRWYLRSGDTEPADVYNRYASFFGRPVVDGTRNARVPLDYALVHTLCEVLERTARTVELAIRRPRVIQTEQGPRLIGWGILPKDTGPTHAQPVNLLLTCRITGNSGAESVSLAWNDDSIYSDGYRIERRALGDGSWEQVGTAPCGDSTFLLGPRNRVPACEYRVLGFTRNEEVCSNVVRIDPPISEEILDPSGPPFATPVVLSPPSTVVVHRAEQGPGLHIGWELPPEVVASGSSGLLAEIQTRGSDQEAWQTYRRVAASSRGIAASDLPGEQLRQVRVAFVDNQSQSSWREAFYTPSWSRRWWLWPLLLLLLAILILLLLNWIPSCSSRYAVDLVPPVVGTPSSAKATNDTTPPGTTPDTTASTQKATAEFPKPKTATPPHDTTATRVDPNPRLPDHRSTTIADVDRCPTCRREIPTIPEGPCQFCPYCGTKLRLSENHAPPEGVLRPLMGLTTGTPVRPSPDTRGPDQAAPNDTLKSSLDYSKRGNVQTVPDDPVKVRPTDLSAEAAKASDPHAIAKGVNEPTKAASRADTVSTPGARDPESPKASTPIDRERTGASASGAALSGAGLTREPEQTRSELGTSARAPTSVASPARTFNMNHASADKLPTGRGLRLRFLAQHPSADGFDPQVPSDPTLGRAEHLGVAIFIDSHAVPESNFQQLRSARMEASDLIAFGLTFLDMQDIHAAATGGRGAGLLMATSVKPSALSNTQRPLFLTQIGGPPDVKIAFLPQQLEIGGAPCMLFIDVDPPDGVSDGSWTSDTEWRFIPEDAESAKAELVWYVQAAPKAGGSVRMIVWTSSTPWKGSAELVRKSMDRVILRTQPIELEVLR